MLRLESLTIKREGTVQWHVVPGSLHCGPAALVRPATFIGAVGPYERKVMLGPTNPDGIKCGVLDVSYVITLTCEPRLDRRGFLVDQVHVHEYVKRFASLPRDLSCERACIELAEAVIAKASKDAPHCVFKTISLTLSPDPHLASITSTFVI